MKRNIAFFAGIAALSSLLAAGSAKAQTYVYGFSDGIATNDALNLMLADNSVVQAPLALNPGSDYTTAFSGWYTDSGINSGAGNDNYIVGNLGANYASFLVYDLSQLQAQIVAAGGVVAASEHIQTFSISNPPQSVDLWDINTSLATLDSYPLNAGGIAIFNDLSSGKLYGGYTYDGSEQGNYIDITLDSSFITDINGVANSQTSSEIGIGHSEVLGVVTGAPLPSPVMASAVLIGLVAVGRKLTRKAIA
jgi:hypothetical protein